LGAIGGIHVAGDRRVAGDRFGFPGRGPSPLFGEVGGLPGEGVAGRVVGVAGVDGVIGGGLVEGVVASVAVAVGGGGGVPDGGDRCRVNGDLLPVPDCIPFVFVPHRECAAHH